MDELARAAAVLGAAAEVAMACHMNPDADALGSMLGLAGFLRARGSRPCARIRTSRWTRPGGRRCCPGSEELVPMSLVPSGAGGDGHLRLRVVRPAGPLGRSASKAAELIWIDHHRSNDGLGRSR